MSLAKRNEILSELYADEDVCKAFSKMQPEDLQDDLKAEVFLALSEMPYSKIIGMYERGEIKFYLVRIMLNMIKSTDKKFFKKYRNFTIWTEEANLRMEEGDQVDLEPAVRKAVDELYWFDKEMFIYYMKLGRNAKELSRYSKIPYLSVIRCINRVKKELKSKIRNHDH